ncbi:MAG: hypothetical protein ACTHZ9_03630 [Leucobacter sp.]
MDHGTFRREDPSVAVGAPWSELSRWSVTWRVMITSSVAGIVGVFIATFSAILESQRVSLIEVPLGPILAILVPVMLGLLSLVVSNWLRGFVPFLQALIFGGLSGGLISVATVTLILVSGGFVPGLVGYSLLYGVPVFLVACAGWLLAIWSATPRGSRVIWPVFGALFVMFIALWALALVGVFTTVPAQETGPTCDWSAEGGVMPNTPC